MAKSRRWGVGIILSALTFAACTSPPQESLVQYQRSVDAAQTAVYNDEAAIQGCVGTNICLQDPSVQALTNDDAKLKADQFKLQVAQYQLKKAEAGSVTSTTTPIPHEPVTQHVNCGALPVGPGAGPPPAACPGTP